MNFKYVAMATALPLLIMASIAEAQNASINTGDTLPEQAKSYIAKSVSASQGKAIILDFWASWCGSCLKKMPVLDSLEKQFAGSLKIVPVNSLSTLDDDKKIKAAIKQVERNHKMKVSFDGITHDTVLDHLFYHRLLPHYVWISPDGKIKAITSSEEVNSLNIQKFLSGDAFVLPEKKDIPKAQEATDQVFLNDDTSRLKVPVTITGTLRLQGEKQGIASAVITLKKSHVTVYSDAMGNFSARSYYTDDSVIIHRAGYEPVTMISEAFSKKPLLIDMSPLVRELENVTVSTGYQQVPKERATGSFAFTDRALFNQQVSTDILSRLEAISNSVSVYRKQNTNGQLMVRGLSTISGPKNPLIIVDNFPYEGDINNINPNEVENITILKDAAAASIWGARAGNGVIVITTRKGRFNQAVQTEFSASITVGDKPDLFYLHPIASADMIDLEQFLYSKGYNLSDTANTSRPFISPVYEVLLKLKRGLITADQSKIWLDSLKRYDVRNDFLKYFYQPLVNQQYSLSVKGGSENIAWLFSGSADKNVSSLAAAYDRINMRSYANYRISSKLSFQTNLYFTQSSTQSGKPGYSSINTSKGRIPPYTRLADDNGNAVAVYTKYRQAYIDTAGAGKLSDWRYYPLTDYQHSESRLVTRDLIADINASYKISRALSADFKYQYESQQVNSRTLNDEQSFFARDLVNTFSQLNTTTGAVTYRVPKGGILDQTTETINSSKFRAQFNVSRTWRRNTIDAIAGTEISEVKYEGNTRRLYGYNDDNLLSVSVDNATAYATYIRGSLLLVPDNNLLQSRLTHFVSFFSNINYSYKARYMLSFSARRDASNNFGVSTNDRWTPLWSAGAGWDVLKEKFMKMAYLSKLRLRITYGYSGNVDPSQSAVTTIAYLNTSPYTQTPAAYIDKYYNPDLRWEKSGQLNLGLDFGITGGHITGSVEYYRKQGKDLYGKTPIDYSAGLGMGVITKNVAEMKGEGADLVLNTINTNGTRGIKWTTNLNLSFYRDHVTRYFLSSQQGSNFINGGNVIAGLEGKPVYSVFAYPSAGLDPLTGDPRGYLKGQISTDYTVLTGSNTTVDDLRYIGRGMPKWFGSLGNTISWKNFSLTARITYQLGFYFMRESINYNTLFSGYAGNSDYALRWQKPGDEISTPVPSLVYPANSKRDAFYNGSEVLAEKGDHIRLQYVTANYSLLPVAGRKPVYRRLELFATASNLGILWKATRYDIDPAYANSVIPPAKTFSAGVRVIF
ncbi:MAG: SusC/RagA family TonB-linked outer membrane protein [Chitinophagaceae bacterium]|nr:SusC/RagA family TonB-linked outer membrane protein [Chitinophagaceae bacterium]